MRTIAVLNLKGGVGKTTTVVNLADRLAAAGKRVLVVDADSQCNTTEFFGTADIAGSLHAILTHRPAVIDERLVCCINRVAEGLEVVPASPRLMELDLTAVTQQQVYPASLREFLLAMAELAAVNDERPWDFCLIDCPPGFTAACTAALMAADEVLIPTTLDAFALSGMANLLQQVDGMRRINPGLRLLGVLPTMVSGDGGPALEQLRAAGLPVLEPGIPRSDKVSGMTWERQALRKYSPRSGPGRAYRRLAESILRGGADNGGAV